MVKVWLKNTYLDGGTEQVFDENEEFYYIDHRIGSPTEGKVFDHYPGREDARQVDVELEIVGDYHDWLNGGKTVRPG